MSWTRICWLIEKDGSAHVGFYETDGNNVHGFVPDGEDPWTQISERQYRQLSLDLRDAALAATQ